MILRLFGRATALMALCAVAASAAAQAVEPATAICAECVRAHMEKLAGDSLRGRACGTEDEHAAAIYIQGELEKAGISPAFAGGMRQAVGLRGAGADHDGRFGAPERTRTYNVVGVIHGTDPDADRKALLLSAHYDHLGVRDGVIYHGADDDASGTAAVLEFARILAAGPRPRRTVYFALFGCEEAGGLGAIYFRAHPPTKLTDLAANIEFEMIGNDDPKRPGVLMLTGWERSNLGPILAAHGAQVGPDLYPEQNLFQRSDNYELALKGVVAQTISGWPVPPTYHDPSDTLEHIDFAFMDQAIASMVEPVRWLVNSDFKPEWNPGMKP